MPTHGSTIPPGNSSEVSISGSHSPRISPARNTGTSYGSESFESETTSKIALSTAEDTNKPGLSQDNCCSTGEADSGDESYGHEQFEDFDEEAEEPRPSAIHHIGTNLSTSERYSSGCHGNMCCYAVSSAVPIWSREGKSLAWFFPIQVFQRIFHSVYWVPSSVGRDSAPARAPVACPGPVATPRAGTSESTRGAHAGNAAHSSPACSQGRQQLTRTSCKHRKLGQPLKTCIGCRQKRLPSNQSR